MTFSPTNLLRFWQTDGGPGISRRPDFDAQTQAPGVRDQAATLLMGGPRPNAMFDAGPASAAFDGMEGNPHGRAHTSFSGWIRSASTAPRDPLFFLLHCNVDRLWAVWQWFNDRFDGTQARTPTSSAAPQARRATRSSGTTWATRCGRGTTTPSRRGR